MDLRGVFVQELSELLVVERTLADDVLPDLIVQVRNEHFTKALDLHRAQTELHVANLEQVFKDIGEKPATEKSHGFEGLQKQHEHALSGIAGIALRDLIHSSAAAHTEHYEISAYHSVIHLAEMLGEPEAVKLLEANLHDEEEALEKLEKSIPERLSEEILRDSDPVK